MLRSDAVGTCGLQGNARRRRRRNDGIGSGLDEHHRPPRRDLGARDATSARSCPRRRHRVTARQPISRCTSSAIGPDIEESRSVLPAPEDPGKPDHLANAEAEHASELEAAPELDETAHSQYRVGQVRGEVTRVDRTDARARENVEARRATLEFAAPKSSSKM